MNSGDGWGLTWFVFLYITAAWIRLYYSPKYNKFIFLGIYVFFSVLVGTALFVTQKYEIAFLSGIVSNWYRYDSVPVYLSSVCLFLFFADCNIKNNIITEIITKLSPLTFGVYLIHHHPQLSPYIWEKANLPQFMGMVTFPLIQIAVCVLIFIACIIVDYLKTLMFVPIELLLNKIKLFEKYNNYFLSDSKSIK